MFIYSLKKGVYPWKIKQKFDLSTKLVEIEKINDFKKIFSSADQINYRFETDNIEVPSVYHPDGDYDFDCSGDYNPDVEYDRNEIYRQEENQVHRNEDKQPTRWIVNLVELSKQMKIDFFEYDFVSSRGNLKRIMLTPKMFKNSWTIRVSKLRNTIFIVGKDNCDWVNNVSSFVGKRFEYFLTNTEYSDIIEEFHGVFKSKLFNEDGEIKLLYNGELDCLDRGETDHTKIENYVEIKTKLLNFKKEYFGLQKIYAHCKLVNVPKLVVGYKSKQTENKFPKITKIQTYLVEDLPKMIQDSDKSPSKFKWKESDLFDFMFNFFKHIQEILEDEFDPKVSYEFTHKDGIIEWHENPKKSEFCIFDDDFLIENSV